MAATAKYDFPGEPPQEVIDFFRRKGWKIGFDYRDVWKEEHLTAFTVAKAMALDLLADIRAAVDDAIANGITFEQFQKDLKPKLQERGWWGNKIMIDPVTGEEVIAEVGTPRRLKIILQTNLRTSYKYGQYQRIQRTKDAFPYLLRTLGPSREHRPEHVAWHGTCLSVDDAWWHDHYPPDAWGCKCRVRQISQAERTRLERSGIPAPPTAATQEKIGGVPTGRRTGDRVPLKTDAPPVEYVDWLNKRTGQVERIPKGVDPGWNYDIGETSRLELAQKTLEEKIAVAPWQDQASMIEIDGLPKLENYRNERGLRRAEDARKKAIEKIKKNMEEQAKIDPSPAAMEMHLKLLRRAYSEMDANLWQSGEEFVFRKEK